LFCYVFVLFCFPSLFFPYLYLIFFLYYLCSCFFFPLPAPFYCCFIISLTFINFKLSLTDSIFSPFSNVVGGLVNICVFTTVMSDLFLCWWWYWGLLSHSELYCELNHQEKADH
jgi:hypothetical protein